MSDENPSPPVDENGVILPDEGGDAAPETADPELPVEELKTAPEPLTPAATGGDVPTGAILEAVPIPQPKKREAEEASPPAGPTMPGLPLWIITAEAEAAAAGAPAPETGTMPAAALKSAPVIDWSKGPAREAVIKAAETLATKAAPLVALPAADQPMTPPSPVTHPPEATPLELVEAAEADRDQVVLQRITKDRRLKLMARVDELLDEIYARLSTSTGQNTLEEVLKLLKTARHTLIENPRDYDTAEYYVYRAKMLLDRFESVRRDSYRWVGLGIFVYEVLLAAVVITGFIFGQPLTDALVARGVPEWAAAPWSTIMAGAAGGIMGALWALAEHTAIKQDFDKQHTMWYLGSPVTGALLGIVLYYMMHAGTWAMGAEVTTSASDRPFLLVLAILVGFQQNVALDLFERFLKLIRPKTT